ncbi:hypothetical protein [Fibrella forsythiae]|uniref:Uncharacterized protein n=1 Tax=Fibrella forsythiae TaxID=2817061 RepID=A0ABS3JQ74_9BACT|nr:hypothetical protein [Fibrella forsythiae]MBO0952159.1 hypothetical protein [Fibrella forsythiae]
MEEDPDFELKISATIHGEDFMPRKLLSMSKLIFDDCQEKGDEYVRKTHKGIHQSGLATLSVAVKSLSERNSQFDSLLAMIVDNYKAIKDSGGISISIWVAVFRSIQGNWEATPEQIQKIASFNGSLAVTYYREA